MHYSSIWQAMRQLSRAQNWCSFGERTASSDPALFSMEQDKFVKRNVK